MSFVRTGLLILLILTLAFFPACSKEEQAPKPQAPSLSVPEGVSSPAPQVPKEKPRFLQDEDGFCSLAFEVDGGLVPSIKKVLPEDQPFSENIGAQIIKALFWELDHRRDLRKGDRCKVVYKKTRDRFKIRVYGVEYYSKLYDKTFYSFFFWEKNKKFPEYFTQSGVAQAKRMKDCPLRHYDEVISLFRKNVKTRRGVKFRVRTGYEIYMPYPAVVEKMNWDLKNDGLGVQVRYLGTGTIAQFVHLSAISNQVEPGSTVSVGSVFARTGISGDTQIPHLEYRLMKETDKGIEGVDPYEFHGYDSYLLPPEAHKDFISVKYQVMAKMEGVDFKE
jgi:murein DD-endopeptidase MepM/ murein hydrolase activator NlpD